MHYPVRTLGLNLIGSKELVQLQVLNLTIPPVRGVQTSSVASAITSWCGAPVVKKERNCLQQQTTTIFLLCPEVTVGFFCIFSNII